MFVDNLISFCLLYCLVYHQCFAIPIKLYLVVFCPANNPINLPWTHDCIPAYLSLGGVAGWGFFYSMCAMLVMRKPDMLLAVLGCHEALLGLLQRPLAALRFEGEGVLLVADCAMMNLANLL